MEELQSQKRDRFAVGNKALLIVMLFLCVWAVMPSVVVIASELGGYVSEKLIGKSGVNNSELVIGRDGTSNSLLDIVMNTTEGVINPNLNPSSPPYQFLYNIFPLVLLGFAVFLLLQMIAKGELDFKTVVIMSAILIYVAIALLQPLNRMITNLLGG